MGLGNALFMEKSKLMEALRSLRADELDPLRRFAASPYFNRQEELVRLLAYLLDHWPSFSGEGLSKTEAYRAVYPGAAFDGKRFRYLTSDLSKLIERFWVQERLEQESIRNGITLLDELSARRLEKAYRKAHRDLWDTLAAHPLRDSSFFFHRLQWAEAGERHFQRQRLRQYDEHIQHASNYLDLYYYLEKLKFTCAMLDRQAIFQSDYQLGISGEWLAHLRKQPFFTEPVIGLYYTILQALLREKEESYFESLEKRLGGTISGIPADSLRDIYLFAINYCARKIRQGRDSYVSKAIELYVRGIESGLLIDNGHLSPWTFTNVVKLALRLKRYGWIEQFIQRYAPMLPPSFRENALHYNLAELYYYTRHFDQAQQHLNQVAFSDLHYYLGARVLLAKIYLESGEIEPLLSLLAAFTIFLKRNKQLSADLKQTYLNFCDILFQLVRRKSRRWTELEDRIRTTPLLTDREWLLQIHRSPGSI